MSTRWLSSSTASGRPLVSILWMLALAGILLSFGAAAAAGLVVKSSSLGAASAQLIACDFGGLALRYRVNSVAQVTAVTIGEIDGGCAGGTITLTLVNASGGVAASAMANLPTSGFDGSISLAISPAVAATSVARAVMAIDGR